PTAPPCPTLSPTRRSSDLQRVEAEAGVVGVDAARHAQQADKVHREEGEVKPDKGEPEVQLAEALRHEPAGELREPIVDPGHQARSEEHTSELQSRENLVCR